MPIRQHQSGFTLLELMVAMSIFAMLAVAGWQVFDSVSRSKERAQIQFNALTDLQYAYTQLQRDMMQIAAYQLPNPQGDVKPQNSKTRSLQNLDKPNNGTNQNNNTVSSGNSLINDNSINDTRNTAVDTQVQSISSEQRSNSLSTAPTVSAFKLENNRLSFIRYADPDPRYLTSLEVERVVYFFNEKGLVRERYTSLIDDSNEHPLQSVLIEEVTAGQFQVLLPAPAQQYPTEQSTQLLQSNRTQSNQQLNESLSSSDSILPKGVQVNFTIPIGNEVTEISWVYALNNTPP